MTRDLSRRHFLGAAAALTTLPAVFRDDPYRPLIAGALPRGDAVRVRGRVAADRVGLSGVAISDGLSVVATDADGRFDLVTDRNRRWVTVSVPGGYSLPTHPTGTARCFQRIAAGPRGEATVTFDLVPLPDGGDRHAFLALADIQTQDAEDMARFQAETVPAIKATLAGLAGVPAFAVGDGDIMWDDLARYDDYERAVREIGIPFVQVVGNHDLDLTGTSDAASTRTFEGRFGPRYYSFNRGRIHYVVLDDVLYYGGGYIGYVDDDQLGWLAADLALVEKGRSVVVFCHIPLMSNLAERSGVAPAVANYVTNREALYHLLAPYRTTILTGHLHESDFSSAGGVWERNLGAVCGAWWTGDICYDGTPNGYGVYEVSGDSIRWRYQSTGRDEAHQMRLYRHGADPKAPDEVLANVWAWEPGASVVWYEDGVRRGAMARRVGHDPLAVARQAGPTLPAKRPWVDPVATGHLFYAPASRTAEVRVEYTDRFGRVSTETLR